jgi:hypothetical protein
MKLSILSFIILCGLYGICMAIQRDPCGPHGEQVPASDLCQCYEGFAGPNPANNCFFLHGETSSIWALISSDPCNTKCDWKEYGDISADYPCVIEDNKTCQHDPCGPHGERVPASDLCECYEGFAGPNPANNCFFLHEESSSIWALISSDPCNTTCDWKECGDISANYPCVAEDNKICH